MNIFGLDKVLARVYSSNSLCAHQFLTIEEVEEALLKPYVNRISILCYSKNKTSRWIEIKELKKLREYTQRYHSRYDNVYGFYFHNNSFATTAFKFNKYPTMYNHNAKGSPFNSLVFSLYVLPDNDNYTINMTYKKKTSNVSLSEYMSLMYKKGIVINELWFKDEPIDIDFIYRDINSLLSDYRDSFLFLFDFLTYDKLFNDDKLFINHLCSSAIDISPMLEDDKLVAPMYLHWYFYLVFGYKYNVVSKTIHRNKRYENGSMIYSEPSLEKQSKDNSKWSKMSLKRMSYTLILNQKKYKPVFFEYFNNIPFIREKYVGNNYSNKTQSEER